MDRHTALPTPRTALAAPYSETAFDAFVQLNFAAWVRYAHLHVGNFKDAELIARELVLQLHETWDYVLGHLNNVNQHALALLRGEIERRCPQCGTDRLVENAAFLRAMRATRQEFTVLAESLGVYSAIAQLPERQFQVIVLRFVLGYGVRETAARLGVSRTTVTGLTHYAKRTLGRDLGLSAEGPEPVREPESEPGSGFGRRGLI
ncbi:MAG TPA: sigma-70 family RNA polymerase sigma factor [Actinospica sp.]|jgi:RNA polymerase sigma-70 factor (ECF subfamily)|nr:sigma-70 family RNA polymerase sigma factor [Actinospica sp.]